MRGKNEEWARSELREVKEERQEREVKEERQEREVGRRCRQRK